MPKAKKSRFLTSDYCVADAVSEAISEIQSLAEECREIVDNAGDGGLSQTQRIQTFDQTAGDLESCDELDVPDCVSELRFQASLEKTPKRGLSRARRCSNAVSLLQGALEAVQAFISEKEDEQSAKETAPDEKEPSEEAQDDSEDNLQEQIDEAQAFADELENIISYAEGAEFPGMFG